MGASAGLPASGLQVSGLEIFRSQWAGSKYRYVGGDRAERDRLLGYAAERDHVIERICLCPTGSQSLDVGGRLVTVAGKGDLGAVIRHCYGRGLGLEVAFVKAEPEIVWLCVHVECRHKAKGR